MRKMVPSEDKVVKIEVLNTGFSASTFAQNHATGYYYAEIDVTNIPQDALVICEHEIEFTSLNDTDLNKDFFSRIYIDDTRKDTPNAIVIYALGDEAIPDIYLTFRLIIFYGQINNL